VGIEKRLVLEQVASALASVHELGIVHRDLKPENVMLDRRGELVRSCLVDFGISRPLERRDAKQFITNPGMVAGTPAYLAPEQWSDRVPDPRTDIYGFGVMAYLMISGQLPFVARDDLELLRLHLEVAPRRPKALDAELEPFIPVVLRCLEKNPAKRPTDGAELAGLLAAAVAPRARRWFRRA
jgi:serine/threonine-protein kinase